MTSVGDAAAKVFLSEPERRQRFAYWLRETRTRQGLTPPQLAKALHVSRGTVNAWESGEQVPSLIWLGTLTEVLQVKASLFSDLPEIPPSGAESYLIHAGSRVYRATRVGRQPKKGTLGRTGGDA